MSGAPYDFSKVHLLVATPCYGGQLYNGYFESILRLQRLMESVGAKLTVRTISNESLITRARNYFCSLMLADETYTHLMFIDSDIVFMPESVLRMLSSNKDVVAGAYPKKSIIWDRVETALERATKENKRIENVSVQAQLYDYAIAWKAVPTGSSHSFQIINGFTQIDYAATGFLMIKRAVLTQMAAAMPHLKYTNDMSGYDTPNNREHFFALFDCVIHPVTKQYLSEDYTFCKRWSDLGGEIWLDVSCNLTHIGTYPFSGSILSCINLKPTGEA